MGLSPAQAKLVLEAHVTNLAKKVSGGGTLNDKELALVQAAASRLYAGIHYRSDNEQGLACGRSVASQVIRRAQSDGAL